MGWYADVFVIITIMDGLLAVCSFGRDCSSRSSRINPAQSRSQGICPQAAE